MATTRKTKQLALPEDLYNRLKAESSSRGCSVQVFVTYLVEFYDLLHIDDLIARYKRLTQLGLNLKQITQTDVLYSYLQTMIRRFGIKR